MVHEGLLFETDYVSVYPIKGYELPQIFKKLVSDWNDTWYAVETIEKVIMVAPNKGDAIMVARILDAVHRR